jgi:uncharacterized SAM-binding protein YcdF (DUF218 family)
MFVFLSKFLPHFIYPLGLVVLLLLVALLLARSIRWTRVWVAIALVILLLGSNTWVSRTLTRSLEWQYLPPETYPQAEVLVVLGGSTGSAQYPRQIVEVSGAADRLFYAAHLYHQGVAPRLLLTAGYITWKSERSPPAEDMAEILKMLNVPAEALWLETESQNTYENAVFSRYILEEHSIDRIVLVTSALHMPRAMALFEKQGIEVIPAPTDYSLTQTDWDRLWEPNLTTQLYNLLPSVGNLEDTTVAMKEYIGIIVYWLQGWL